MNIGGPVDDDDRLWDALSHHEKQEIRQHQRQKNSAITDFGENIMSVLKKATSSITNAAASAGFSVPATGKYGQSVQSNNLSEFGIGDLQLESSREFLEHTSTSEETEVVNDHPPLDTPLLSYPTTTASHNSYSREQTKGTNRDYVLLKNFRRRSPSSREGWGYVSNLDLFFTSIYSFYYHRGILPIICHGLVELVSLFFTLWLSVLLFAYVDWSALTTCRDENTCRAYLGDYFIEHPFAEFSMWNLIIKVYFTLFFGYGCISIASFVTTVRDALEAKDFYENELGISSRRLGGGAVEWDDIVCKIIKLQESGEYRIAVHGQELNALVVAQRVLRKENFMIAFFNCGIFDLRIPLPWPFGVNGHSKGQYLSTNLEWSLHLCVLSYMFNHKYQVRPSFLDESSLKRRFFLCGIAQGVFMPFLLLFMILHFLLLNMYDWRSTKNYMGPRQWSKIARWTFREFNELPHTFERRIAPSHEAADSYLSLFTQNAIITSIGRVIVYISGSLLAFLFLLAALDDSILLHVKVGKWNLLWYVGMIGIAFSIGKSLLPNAEIHKPQFHKNYFADMNSALHRVASHTHHFPDTWKNRAWKRQTYQEFTSLFLYKSQLFIIEVLSVIFAPLVLCVSLPKSASRICSFVRQIKISQPGMGEICGYSIFDFDIFADENWEGKGAIKSSHGDNDDRSSHSIHPGLSFYQNSRPKTRQGKMEKSFFSFKAAHPTWQCSSSGQNLVDRLEGYHREQKAAIAKERQHHIEAAAKQLEILLLIEKQHRKVGQPYENKDNENHFAGIEKEVGKNEQDGGADSGGDGIHNTKDHTGEGQNVGLLDQKRGSVVQHNQSNVNSFMTLPLGQNISRSSHGVEDLSTLGLSTELQRILSHSSFDMPSIFNVNADSTLCDTEMMYSRLDQYHAAEQEHHRANEEHIGN